MNSSESADIIRRVLGSNYLSICLSNVVIEDDLHDRCVVSIRLTNGDELSGCGTGPVDAIFSAFMGFFSSKYCSLRTIKLERFEVKINYDTGKNQYRGDAECTVSLCVENSRGFTFEFSHTSKSISSSVAHAVAGAIEFYINSEMAFCKLRLALKDAEQRNRQDLVGKYLKEITVVNNSACYESIVPKK